MITIRKGKKEDFVEIHKLLLDIFPNALVKIEKEDEFFVASENQNIIGFAHVFEDRKKIILKGLGVAEKFRKKGIGSALLDRLIAYAKKKRKCIYLKTKIGNQALMLYYRHGFYFKRLNDKTLTLVFGVHR